MSSDRIQYLLQKLFNNQCTPEEKQELALWIDTIQQDDEWKSRLGEIWNSYEPVEKIDPMKADAMLKKIIEEGKSIPLNSLKENQKPIINRLYRISVVAAAVIGILIVLSIVFVTKNFEPRNKNVPTNLNLGKADIAPGGNKAMLILANGNKILLDSAHNGSLANLGNTKVVKLNNGQLAYNAIPQAGEHRTESPKVEFNTLRTPPGGQYRITLPDGTEAWLNAASSIRFPSTFTGNKRMVSVTGEVYFEVAKNSDCPFEATILSSEGKPEGNILVLGTSFNVNAYKDESDIKTTLLNGKVKITNTSSSLSQTKNEGIILLPGQQALMKQQGAIKVKKDVNLNEIVAWKNGLFDFEGNDIQSVMRQVARWYNIEVKYENVSSAHFMGTISRSANISEVLKMLELTGAVHFKVEGRVITVTR